ncbi:MAG TPA: OmpA family protein [Gemmatimonadales bacterium]|nr:OmpA family protein [Gemmatimonadales bacterium]
MKRSRSQATRMRRHGILRPWRLVRLAMLVAPPLAGGIRPASAQQPSVRIPLCTGLTIVTAIARPEGDYESIKTITATGPTEIGIAYSAQVPKGPGVMRNFRMRRTIRRADLDTASLYVHYFHSKGATSIPGSTAIGTSRAVLHALKTQGATSIELVPGGSSAMPGDPTAHPNIYDYMETYRLIRVGDKPVPVAVVVNDAAAQLPAIQARGDYMGDQAEFFFLDDEDNPLTLRYHFESAGEEDEESKGLQVVKIAFGCPAVAAGSDRVSRLERELRERRRALVYDLYFDFNSAALRQESDSTLRVIAEVLRRNPEWKLSIEGHTDDVASDRYNLELSGRRAAAVKEALVGGFGVAGARLTTTGYGEARPQDRNDTVEGRARNRRVELVRQ